MAMDKVINELKTVKGIHVVRCGTWLWIDGETKPVKELLKKLGCRYSSKKQEWYWHEGHYFKLSRHGALPMHQIYDMYGIETVIQ